jgi:hypothetical protein
MVLRALTTSIGCGMEIDANIALTATHITLLSSNAVNNDGIGPPTADTNAAPAHQHAITAVHTTQPPNILLLLLPLVQLLLLPLPALLPCLTLC